jgi:hypothetical protein
MTGFLLKRLCYFLHGRGEIGGNSDAYFSRVHRHRQAQQGG